MAAALRSLCAVVVVRWLSLEGDRSEESLGGGRSSEAGALGVQGWLLVVAVSVV